MRKKLKKKGVLICMVLLGIGWGVWNKVNIEKNQEPKKGIESMEKQQTKSWMQDTAPVELSVFIVEENHKIEWDIVNNPHHKKITKETGVTLDITAGNEDKLNSLIASGNLPDIISIWTGYSQRRELENTNQLYSIEELVESYAPTFTNLPKSMLDWFRNKNTEKTYVIANYFYTPEYVTKESYTTTHNRITARKDLLDQLQLTQADFATKDFFIDSLKKVREAKIQYNGNTVTPFVLGASQLWQSIEYLAQYFGVSYEDGKTGDWLDYRREPETLEALLFANELYREGLIDLNSLTLDNDTLKEMVNEGKIFSTIGMVGSNTYLLTNDDPEAYMVPIEPEEGFHSKGVYSQSDTGAGWQAVCITKQCEKPDRAIRFLEYLMEDEHMLESYIGPRGNVWEYDEEGVAQYRQEFLQEQNENPKGVIKKYGIGQLFFTYNPLILQKYLPEPRTRVEQKSEELDKHYGKYAYESKAFDGLITEADYKTSQISDEINNKWNMGIVEIITAENENDATQCYYDTISQMDRLGWNEFHEEINKVFWDRKERLGVQFTHPYNQ